jgi:hypothetical protein
MVWVRMGIRTFWRQPVAISGLFFMFMALLSLLAFIPYAGSFITMMLLPAATIGFMAAARQANLNQFPMPSVLLIGLSAHAPTRKSMIHLGFIYAVCFFAILGVSALYDGGTFASLYLTGNSFSQDTISTSNFQNAMWVATALYLPLSALFWYSPALVHWHSEPVLKSLFFSFVACWSNWRAFLVYALTWSAVFISVATGLALMAVVINDEQWMSFVLLPVMLLLAAMFFTSSYFTFIDCFTKDPFLA